MRNMDFLTETEKNENMCDDQRYTSLFFFFVVVFKEIIFDLQCCISFGCTEK